MIATAPPPALRRARAFRPRHVDARRGSSAGFVLANVSYVGLLTMGQSIYMGVLTDNIPRKRRGWVFGLRTLVLGIGGILTGGRGIPG